MQLNALACILFEVHAMLDIKKKYFLNFVDVSIPSEQSTEEGLDKQFLTDPTSLQLMGLNGMGQTITTISRPPRQVGILLCLSLETSSYCLITVESYHLFIKTHKIIRNPNF